MEITIGSLVEGSVTRITAFGAFVDLGNGTSGLIHISEIAHAYVKDINEYLKVGDTVKVKVVSMDAPGKIGLSLKQAQAPPPPPERKEQPFAAPRQAERSVSFEDKLARFMKDSNDKLVELKRHQEGRKGRGGK